MVHGTMRGESSRRPVLATRVRLVPARPGLKPRAKKPKPTKGADLVGTQVVRNCVIRQTGPNDDGKGVMKNGY